MCGAETQPHCAQDPGGDLSAQSPRAHAHHTGHRAGLQGRALARAESGPAPSLPPRIWFLEVPVPQDMNPPWARPPGALSPALCSPRHLETHSTCLKPSRVSGRVGAAPAPRLSLGSLPASLPWAWRDCSTCHLPGRSHHRTSRGSPSHPVPAPSSQTLPSLSKLNGGVTKFLCLAPLSEKHSWEQTRPPEGVLGRVRPKAGAEASLTAPAHLPANVQAPARGSPLSVHLAPQAQLPGHPRAPPAPTLAHAR